MTGILETQSVIFKPFPLCQRNVKAGMPAKTEIHTSGILVFNFVDGLQRVFVKCIVDSKNKISGILGVGLRVRL